MLHTLAIIAPSSPLDLGKISTCFYDGCSMSWWWLFCTLLYQCCDDGLCYVLVIFMVRSSWLSRGCLPFRYWWTRSLWTSAFPKYFGSILLLTWYFYYLAWLCLIPQILTSVIHFNTLKLLYCMDSALYLKIVMMHLKNYIYCLV